MRIIAERRVSQLLIPFIPNMGRHVGIVAGMHIIMSPLTGSSNTRRVDNVCCVILASYVLTDLYYKIGQPVRWMSHSLMMSQMQGACN